MEVPALLAPLAARHRLDIAVGLDLHASAADDAVFVLDAREHDLRAGTAQDVDDGDDLDLLRAVGDWHNTRFAFVPAAGADNASATASAARHSAASRISKVLPGLSRRRGANSMRYSAVVLNASAARQYHAWCACAQLMASQ